MVKHFIKSGNLCQHLFLGSHLSGLMQKYLIVLGQGLPCPKKKATDNHRHQRYCKGGMGG